MPGETEALLVAGVRGTALERAIELLGPVGNGSDNAKALVTNGRTFKLVTTDNEYSFQILALDQVSEEWVSDIQKVVAEATKKK